MLDLTHMLLFSLTEEKIKELNDEYNKKKDELEKYKEDEIIVICARGIRSDMAAKLLRENGFNALNLSGGMIAYRALEKENEEESNKEVIKE